MKKTIKFPARKARREPPRRLRVIGTDDLGQRVAVDDENRLWRLTRPG